ncbi:MAG: NAD(P)-binding protein, partial [Betaproteobacteria bacterium]
MQQRDTHVTILGGGLAGMSLALQLKYKRPNIGITVIEKNSYPVNDTTAKVGESTVEIAAHYFGDVL